jgi:glucokinase
MTTSSPSPSRPPADLCGPVLIGIDVGGTKILGGIVTPDGAVLFRHQVATRRDHLMEDIGSVAETVTAEAARRGLAVAGIGVGMTGFIDRTEGTLVRSINMDLTDVPIGKNLRARTGLPVFVDNDVHAATLAEIRFGAGRRHQHFLVYNAGTGLATGIVFNGMLYRGASNAAGENGHISSDQSGQSICACGTSGSIERLLLDTRAGKQTVPAYLPRVEPPVSKEYGYLALNIVQLVNLLNPSAIVLAGGMFAGNPEATDWVKRAVYAHALPLAADALEEFALSRTAPFTGLIGAAVLVLEGQTLPGPLETSSP